MYKLWNLPVLSSPKKYSSGVFFLKSVAPVLCAVGDFSGGMLLAAVLGPLRSAGFVLVLFTHACNSSHCFAFTPLVPSKLRFTSFIWSQTLTCPYTTIGGPVIVGKGLLLSCGLLPGHLIILLIKCIGISGWLFCFFLISVTRHFRKLPCEKIQPDYTFIDIYMQQCFLTYIKSC